MNGFVAWETNVINLRKKELVSVRKGFGELRSPIGVGEAHTYLNPLVLEEEGVMVTTKTHGEENYCVR